MFEVIIGVFLIGIILTLLRVIGMAVVGTIYAVVVIARDLMGLPPLEGESTYMKQVNVYNPKTRCYEAPKAKPVQSFLPPPAGAIPPPPVQPPWERS